ncbi:bacillithiol biosynthesis deacetylase BshB2 [Bacillus sp. FJAT-42315]|uniref:bacillithiol biosynthesis deacetylase BshB2 n=1 Tax=Bacillus sp. FJAT-42315 TaxID=2014077 RepID=UPI000C24C97C|nr:bacillithiol biosynthesis deacetylase BshB2 [Bacillus sp. FJAT-42315]
MEIEKERHVLVIFPHPDDEAFGVSGTIATHTKRGTPVTYACLTLGEMGRNLGNPPFTTRESLPEIRKSELKAATKALKIDDLRMMGLRDKTLEFEDDKKMADLVSNLIDELNPSLVISFYPEFSVHPDHEATARAVVRAIRRLPENERPKLHCVAFANNTDTDLGAPDIIYDINDTFEQKMDALRAHISQTAWMLKEMEKLLHQNDEQTIQRIKFERFWSYRWDDDQVSEL